MKNGFYTALGTPLDMGGNLVEKSFEKHVEDQISAGAAGLLCMGSMGNMTAIKNSEYAKTARVCAKTVNGRIPLMTGVMDCSVQRVLNRIESLKGLKIDGIVATAPYYYKVNAEQIKNYFQKIADSSHFPLYLYDLPPVTQVGIPYDTVVTLAAHPNVKGIKSANLYMIRKLIADNCLPDGFDVLYSGLDIFDIAIKYGIKKNLDGMFACTPINSKKMYASMNDNNLKETGKHLTNILKLRDLFIKHMIFPSFTKAMNILGYEGIFNPDYDMPVSRQAEEEIKQCLKEINEL